MSKDVSRDVNCAMSACEVPHLARNLTQLLQDGTLLVPDVVVEPHDPAGVEAPHEGQVLPDALDVLSPALGDVLLFLDI